jgi:uncharacterized protein DUF1203
VDVAEFRFLPIDADLVRTVRETLRDEHGNVLHVQVSDAPAPCRACLRIAASGTRLILFAHRPFTTNGPYAEIGPVYVHAEACAPYCAHDGFPADFRPRRLTFRAYDHAGSINDGMLAEGVDAEKTLAHLFADERVATVHVRNPAWGCFDFAVERA